MYDTVKIPSVKKSFLLLFFLDMKPEKINSFDCPTHCSVSYQRSYRPYRRCVVRSTGRSWEEGTSPTRSWRHRPRPAEHGRRPESRQGGACAGGPASEKNFSWTLSVWIVDLVAVPDGDACSVNRYTLTQAIQLRNKIHRMLRGDNCRNG